MSQPELSTNNIISSSLRSNALLRSGEIEPNQDRPAISSANEDTSNGRSGSGNGRKYRIFGLIMLVLAVLALVAFLFARHYVGKAMNDNLPKVDGTQTVYGLAAPVQVQRDAHGVPHIHAQSMADLIFAQGFVTAQDRLWQMDLLRRHASGQLAAILGRSALDHDRVQRTLQLRAAADRAIEALPKDQKHWLDVYAAGVNASIVEQRAHLPIEFRLIGYEPAPWTSRDSILVEMAMFQDLTTGFPDKLGHEALAAHLPAELIADLYPVGSWRDHPPGAPIPDPTAPQPEIKTSRWMSRKPSFNGRRPAPLQWKTSWR